MRRRTSSFLILCLLMILFFSMAKSARAARGAPGSAEFGFGAILHTDGPYLKEALELALDLRLDWIAVPVLWEARQPEAGLPPRLETLDPVMRFAEEHGIAVVVSVSQPPAWALTASGPDPAHAAAFTASIAQRYPRAVQAFEVFPGANTRAAWGANPDPAAYMTLFTRVQEQLRAVENTATLIAGGLQPVARGYAEDVSDIDFLQGLYNAGAAREIAILSLQYPQVNADPLLLPTEDEPGVLRRYEELRKVMTANDHATGKIWITNFHSPSVTIGAQGSQEASVNQQAVWTAQAYTQLRAQLYVGAAFLQSLNTEVEGTGEQVPSLLNEGGEMHPFFYALRDLVALNHAGSPEVKPGKPKDGNFEKYRP